MTVQAGFQGATPELAVRPVDQSLPVCGQPLGEATCTRKLGHYGRCGIAVPGWLLTERDLIATLERMAESDTVYSRQIVLRQAVAMLRAACT